MHEVWLNVGTGEGKVAEEHGQIKIVREPAGIVVQCRESHGKLSNIALFQEHKVFLLPDSSTRMPLEVCYAKTLLCEHTPHNTYISDALKVAYRLADLLANGALAGRHAYDAAYDVFWWLYSKDEKAHKAISKAVPAWSSWQEKIFHCSSDGMAKIIIPLDWSRGEEVHFSVDEYDRSRGKTPYSLINWRYGSNGYAPKTEDLKYIQGVLEECLTAVEEQLFKKED